jgi:sulfite reductase alpha subunit-like flavoprotein
MDVQYREEEILVLFGSQRGSAEKMATEIADRLPSELSARSILDRTTRPSGSSAGPDHRDARFESDDGDPAAAESIAGNEDRARITIVPKLMSLDDFARDGYRWTRIVIIVVSSFGTGEAPMNAKIFRRACESWTKELKGATKGGEEKEKARGERQRWRPRADESRSREMMNRTEGTGEEAAGGERFLDGLRFAILGFGDSFYKTYQKNPMVVEEALSLAGGRIIGSRGASDADMDKETNQKAIDSWLDSLWSHLAYVLVEEPLPEHALERMQLLTARRGAS